MSLRRALFLVYGKSNNSGLWRIPFIMICIKSTGKVEEGTVPVPCTNQMIATPESVDIAFCGTFMGGGKTPVERSACY